MRIHLRLKGRRQTVRCRPKQISLPRNYAEGQARAWGRGGEQVSRHQPAVRSAPGGLSLAQGMRTQGG